MDKNVFQIFIYNNSGGGKGNNNNYRASNYISDNINTGNNNQTSSNSSRGSGIIAYNYTKRRGIRKDKLFKLV